MNCLTCKRNKSPKALIARLRLTNNSIKPTERFDIICKKSIHLPAKTININYRQITKGNCGPYKPI